MKRRHIDKEYALCLLCDAGIRTVCLSELSSHYRFKDFDFWLTTGKYFNRKTFYKGEGVENLIEEINKSYPQPLFE